MFAFIFSFWILPSVLAYACIYYKKMEHPLSYLSFHVFLHNVLLNGLCYVFTQKSVLNNLSPDYSFYIWTMLASTLISLLSYYLYTKLLTKRTYKIYCNTTFLCMSIFSICYVYFFWLLGESGRLPFEVFLYNLQNPINTEVANFDIQIFGLICLISSLLVSLWYLIYFSIFFVKLPFKKRNELTRKCRMAAVILPIPGLGLSLFFPIYSFHLEDAYNYLYASGSFIEEKYVDPNDVTLTWPEEKRNLIYVFVESFESSSFSKELGGMRDVNLLPQLTNMMGKGVSFSDKETGFGGGISMPQATVTLSGITAYLGGVNYKIPVGMEKNETAVVLPGLTTITDLLYEQGYQEHMKVGMAVDGYYIGTFFREHGKTLTKGLDEVKEEGLLDPDYSVWWGFEDSKLFDFAKDDLTAIAETEEPFVYSVISNNTHRVDGYTEEICDIDQDFSYPMENAIYCEDQLLAEFLQWIMEQPFYENTTVVIVGDHLGHEEAYTQTLDPQEDRRIFNLILNPVQTDIAAIQSNRQFWSADMFPTVLSAIGVDIEGNRLGLGVNLFSKEKTLIEEYGRTYVSEQLTQQSSFYTDKFLTSDK